MILSHCSGTSNFHKSCQGQPRPPSPTTSVIMRSSYRQPNNHSPAKKIKPNNNSQLKIIRLQFAENIQDACAEAAGITEQTVSYARTLYAFTNENLAKYSYVISLQGFIYRGKMLKSSINAVWKDNNNKLGIIPVEKTTYCDGSAGIWKFINNLWIDKVDKYQGLEFREKEKN